MVCWSISKVRFAPTIFEAKGKEKKYKSARYVAWIIPAVGSGEVQIVDLGEAEAIDNAIQAARKSVQAVMDENSVLKQQGEVEAEKQSGKICSGLRSWFGNRLQTKLAGRSN